jgi:hypothetical protein
VCLSEWCMHVRVCKSNAPVTLSSDARRGKRDFAATSVPTDPIPAPDATGGTGATICRCGAFGDEGCDSRGEGGAGLWPRLPFVCAVLLLAGPRPPRAVSWGCDGASRLCGGACGGG